MGPNADPPQVADSDEAGRRAASDTSEVLGPLAPLPRWVVLGAAATITLVLAVAAVAILGRWVLDGPVTASSLARSLAVDADVTPVTTRSTKACRPVADNEWRCTVDDTALSSTAEFLVTIRAGSSCWDARPLRLAAGSALPRRASGCVERWQWTLFGF